MNQPDKFTYAAKRVEHANRLNADRGEYHSPSIEEIAARAHGRGNPVIHAHTTGNFNTWGVEDYWYAFHGFMLLAALACYFLWH